MVFIVLSLALCSCKSFFSYVTIWNWMSTVQIHFQLFFVNCNVCKSLWVIEEDEVYTWCIVQNRPSEGREATKMSFNWSWWRGRWDKQPYKEHSLLIENHPLTQEVVTNWVLLQPLSLFLSLSLSLSVEWECPECPVKMKYFYFMYCYSENMVTP